MTKIQKITLYTGITLVSISAILLGYHFYSGNKNKNNKENNENKENKENKEDDFSEYNKIDLTETTSDSKEIGTDNTNIIKLGKDGNVTKGKYVALLQDLLNFLDGANLIVDGRFGEKTIKAWRNHQGLLYSFDTSITKTELGKLLLEAKTIGYKYSNELIKTIKKYKY